MHADLHLYHVHLADTFCLPWQLTGCISQQEEEDEFDKERQALRSYVIKRCSRPVASLYGDENAQQVRSNCQSSASLPAVLLAVHVSLDLIRAYAKPAEACELYHAYHIVAAQHLRTFMHCHFVWALHCHHVSVVFLHTLSLG